jgi:hypothetical protein
VRPKSFIPADDASPEDQRNAFTAQIELTEMLGEELLVHIEAGPHKLVVSANPHDVRCHAEQISICPLLSRAHVFDRETGMNLTLSRSTARPVSR